MLNVSKSMRAAAMPPNVPSGSSIRRDAVTTQRPSVRLCTGSPTNNPRPGLSRWWAKYARSDTLPPGAVGSELASHSPAGPCTLNSCSRATAPTRGAMCRRSCSSATVPVPSASVSSTTPATTMSATSITARACSATARARLAVATRLSDSSRSRARWTRQPVMPSTDAHTSSTNTRASRSGERPSARTGRDSTVQDIIAPSSHAHHGGSRMLTIMRALGLMTDCLATLRRWFRHENRGRHPEACHPVSAHVLIRQAGAAWTALWLQDGPPLPYQAA